MRAKKNLIHWAVVIALTLSLIMVLVPFYIVVDRKSVV